MYTGQQLQGCRRATVSAIVSWISHRTAYEGLHGLQTCYIYLFSDAMLPRVATRFYLMLADSDELHAVGTWPASMTKVTQACHDCRQRSMMTFD
jgi:hypothetical protein